MISIDPHLYQSETTHHQAQLILSKHYLNILHISIRIQTYWIPHPQTIAHPLHIHLIEQQ